jgi:hypothetical protein
MEAELRHARHNLRGRINALKLCVSAFEVLDTRQEALEFLDMIEQAADRTVVALDALEEVLDRNGAPTSS